MQCNHHQHVLMRPTTSLSTTTNLCLLLGQLTKLSSLPSPPPLPLQDFMIIQLLHAAIHPRFSKDSAHGWRNGWMVSDTHRVLIQSQSLRVQHHHRIVVVKHEYLRCSFTTFNRNQLLNIIQSNMKVTLLQTLCAEEHYDQMLANTPS